MKTNILWQQILAAPQDETLQADFVHALVEAGDPRARIFRLAAELQAFPVYYVQHDGIARQYESSLELWREEFAKATQAWQAEINFVQGWPVEITIAAYDFIFHAADIVATIPLRHLNLTHVRDTPDVFTLPQWNQIVSLDGSRQPWSHEAITALAASPRVASLRWLDLSDTGIEDADVEPLAASPYLKEVAHLDLQNNPCRNPVDASEGYGVDGFTGLIVNESICLPAFGRKLEARYGVIGWLHALGNYMEKHPPSRYQF